MVYTKLFTRKNVIKFIGLNNRLRFNKNLLIKNKLNKYLKKNIQFFKNNSPLKSQKTILYLKKINCNRGIRHTHCLPVRGQRTKTNARTMKRHKIYSKIKKNEKKAITKGKKSNNKNK